MHHRYYSSRSIWYVQKAGLHTQNVRAKMYNNHDARTSTGHSTRLTAGCGGSNFHAYRLCRYFVLATAAHVSPPPPPPLTNLPTANLHDGQCRYTADLLQLSSASQFSPISHNWPRYIPPINMRTFTTYLNRFPDKIFVRYITEGLFTGFRIDYTGSRDHVRSTRSNHPS